MIEKRKLASNQAEMTALVYTMLRFASRGRPELPPP
jgi:hypothetical protein